MLKTPATTAHLAGYFKRSMARVQEILVDLKKEGLVNTFRAGSSNYWTTRKDIVIVSRRKLRYLNAIARGVKKTSEVAAEIEVGWKAARNRLVELKNLGLIYDEEGKWCIQKNLPNVLIR